jgi:hypothetical protein
VLGWLALPSHKRLSRELPARKVFAHFRAGTVGPAGPAFTMAINVGRIAQAHRPSPGIENGDGPDITVIICGPNVTGHRNVICLPHCNTCAENAHEENDNKDDRQSRGNHIAIHTAL